MFRRALCVFLAASLTLTQAWAQATASSLPIVVAQIDASLTSSTATTPTTTTTTTAATSADTIAAGASACFKVEAVCLEPAETRVIDGVPVTRECWKWSDTYQCKGTELYSNCQPLLDRGCEQIGDTQCTSAVTPTGGAAACEISTKVFRCALTPPRNETVDVCTTNYCAEGGDACFDTTAPPDGDIGLAIAGYESQRQAGVYGFLESPEIFKGFAESCSVKTVGGSSIKSCCGAIKAGGYRNYDLVGTAAKAAWAVASEEGKALWSAGSKYVYDTLFAYNYPALAEVGVNAAAASMTNEAAVTSATSAAGGTQFGAYGFTFSYSAAEGFTFVSFDLVTFIIAIVILIISIWLACSTEDQVVALKRGQNLCSYLKTECTSRFLGICFERAERHCCFNSVLAKIINRQGRAQLGMSLDVCGGFSVEEVGRLDFSLMDFSEFIATLEVTAVDTAAAMVRANTEATKLIGDYYEQHRVNPSLPGVPGATPPAEPPPGK